MSAHLQFGPEWMRKGPSKSNGPTSGSEGNSSSQEAPAAPAPVASTIGTGSSKSASNANGNNRRHPSLGKLSANPLSPGISPTTPSAGTTPSTGTFSFAAAAAQAGAAKDANAHTSSSSSSALPLSSDGDSIRYSKRLLSLYSSERGGKPPVSKAVDAPSPTSPNTSMKKQQQNAYDTGGTGSTAERTSRRSGGSSVEGLGVHRPHSPSGEPRGLNARSASSTIERPPSQRPGLFQRGSGGVATVSAAALSPTLFQSRERDRHGAGIQGGVLSGVAPPSSRRRKDSELTGDTLRSNHTPQDGDQHWEQRRVNDVFTSARSRNNRTVTSDGAQNADTSSGGIGASALSAHHVTPNGEVIETWSRFGGRRERAPGEGPIGPPADHSGGFSRFSDRRRERQASSFTGGKRSSDVPNSKFEAGRNQSSSDADLAKHATYVLDALHLDDEEDEDVQLVHQQRQQPRNSESDGFSVTQSRASAPEWSPETQEWLYRDLQGQIQGPFKAIQMQDWYHAKYFQHDLLIRRAEEAEFETLGEKLLTIGDVVTPFLVSPTSYAGRPEPPKAQPLFEQPAASSEVGGSFFPNHQQIHPLGWPGNMDVLNHFGSGSGRSSPFATPQGHYAELDSSQRFRQRTQQEQYMEMIRQKEIAEQRALQEQRAAQMAAITMAQAQGRDPASLGVWGADALMNRDWSQGVPHAGYDAPAQHFPMHQGSDPFAHRSQGAWEQRAEQGMIQQPQAQVYQQQQQQPPDVYHEINVPEAEAQESSFVELHELSQHNEMLEEKVDAPASIEESALVENADAALEEDTLNASIGIEENENEGIADEQALEEEQAPEDAWPQSPTAVEFASEPLMSEEQWAKEESPSRGKKSKRERTKHRGGDDDQTGDSRGASRNASGITSGSVRTMGEDQFRQSQMHNRESSRTTQAPLSSWLPDSASANAPTKAAPWANNGPDTASSGLSLREIQEAEARQAEARKAARQRQQLSAAQAPSSGGSGDASTLPATMSWGLASSHASNGRSDSFSTPSSANPTATTPGTPVWNARQAPKKTLMEIQEEERLRTQKTKDLQAAQTAARSKAYADTASKLQTANASLPSGNGNWSVVGSGGKQAAATPTNILTRPGSKANASPVTQRTVGSSSIGGSPWNGVAASPGNGSTVKPSPARKASSQAISSSDKTPAPSPEFIRHCKEQLKGLNAKVDDFIEMLLSFPLDPSPDVVEIIAESVYASSSTLDGRRFAADFVAKRKLDAAQSRGLPQSAVRSSSASSAFNGSPIGMRNASDVLKSSAPSNDGFGGFKVVKAKGTKKRA